MHYPKFDHEAKVSENQIREMEGKEK